MTHKLLPVAALSLLCAVAAVPEADAGAAAYKVQVTDWEGPVSEEGYVVVTVEAQGAHKINVKYPQKLRLDRAPDGLELPLRKLGMKEAQLEGDKRLSFTIPAIPKRAGSFDVRGMVKIGVCNDSACMTDKHPVHAVVRAQ